MINGLLHINKHLRFTVEQIKQHDWFRRRPSRTYEIIPFPPLALNRFESFTMYDYITDLHQSPIKSEDNHINNNEEDQQNGTTSVFNSPIEEQPNHRTALNCTCSQAISGENIIPQNKARNKNQPKICSLS